MVHGNFPFHFGGDFYPTRSGFEDPNQRPMQPYYHPYSLTSSQVQYEPNSVDFGGSSQSSSMSGSASATPSPGSTEQQTSWSARPCSGVGSSQQKSNAFWSWSVLCHEKIFRSKTVKTSSCYQVHISPWKHKCHSKTHVSVMQMRIKNWRDIVVFTLRGATFSWQQTKLSLVRIGPNLRFTAAIHDISISSVFPQFKLTSYHVSFLSRIKMNSINLVLLTYGCT